MKLGKAFSDTISVEHKREFRLHDGDGNAWWLGSGRPLLFSIILFLIFFALGWRLFNLTVINGYRYRALADGNRTRDLVRHAPRGNLLDRTGKPLTVNLPQYRLLKPCGKEGTTDERSACVSRITSEEGERLVKDGLPSGWFLEVDYNRQYLFPEATAHLTGYTGELSEEELKDQYFALRNYQRGDRIGRTGAEAVFEDRLRGRDGRELIETDAAGHILRTLGRDTEREGESITLSVDAALAEVARRAFPDGAKGAVIVSKPTTGEILALYSSPSFTPNAFSLGMSQSEYDALVGNPNRPMFNRAIGGVYPPGSTFKIVTALAALEEGAVSKSTVVEDTGVIHIGPFEFPNWFWKQYGKTDGAVDIVKALQRSNDIYFYKAGEWMGITKLAKWATRIGLGKPLGIELGGEAAGLMPDPDWKQKNFQTAGDLAARNNEWYLGDTYHVSIGQGYLLTTPLQVNAWTNVIANGGKICPPTILKLGDTGKNRQRCISLNIKQETIDLVRSGMQRACASGGTGWPLFDFGVKRGATYDPSATTSAGIRPDVKIPVACKTGTAEFGDPNNKTHAWFTAFAPVPADDLPKDAAADGKILTGEPEIAVTVLVEGAGEGSDRAAPVAKKILEEWFSR